MRGNVAGTYTKLYYHIVFSTKQRLALITPDIEIELYKYIAGIIRQLKGSCVVINGMADHLHILTILPATAALSDVLRTIKASSSRWVHEQWPSHKRFGWQDGYSAFTVSRSQLDTVEEYVRKQKSHHSTNDFRAELMQLLKKHGVDYDEQYVWD